MSFSSTLLWRGLLAAVIGIVSVAWPDVTIGAVVVLFAVYAFIAAATDSARAFSGDRAGSVVGYLILAVLSFAAGMVALLWPGITALILTFWVAAWALITGFTEVIMAFQARETAGERALWAVSGLVSAGLGVVLFVRPDIGALSLASVFGLFSLFYGISTMVLYFQTRAEVKAAPAHTG